MAMKKDNKCHRVNFVVTDVVQQQVTQVCDETGLNESEFWRAAGNKLFEFLQSHGFSAIHQYRKDVTYEAPKKPIKQNIVPFSRDWSRMESGMVLGCNEASTQAMFIICTLPPMLPPPDPVPPSKPIEAVTHSTALFLNQKVNKF